MTTRLCFLPSSFGRSLNPDNKAGSAWFGIDAQYLLKVQKREIFDLVGDGWNSDTLYKMSIEERRYYYHLLIEKHAPKNQPPPGQMSSKKTGVK